MTKNNFFKKMSCLKKMMVLTYNKVKNKLLILIGVLDTRRIEIFLISLAVVSYGITIYTSARVSESNFYFQASLKAYENKALIDLVPKEQVETYRDLTDTWIQASEYFRGRTRIWSYASICCMWSLLFLLATFPFLIFKTRLWIIPYCICGIFLCLTLYVHIFKIGFSNPNPIIEKLAIFPFLSTYFPDWEVLVDMVKNGIFI